MTDHAAYCRLDAKRGLTGFALARRDNFAPMFFRVETVKDYLMAQLPVFYFKSDHELFTWSNQGLVELPFGPNGKACAVYDQAGRYLGGVAGVGVDAPAPALENGQWKFKTQLGRDLDFNL